LIGEKSDRLIEQFKETGKETLDKAKAVTERVAKTTMEIILWTNIKIPRKRQIAAKSI
jgi:hypothetical protein